MAAGGDAEAEGQQLDKKAHERSPQQQPEQRIAGDGAGLKITLQVSRIKKGDAHEKAGAGESPELLPREGRDGDAGRVGGLDLDGVEMNCFVGFVRKGGGGGWEEGVERLLVCMAVGVAG